MKGVLGWSAFNFSAAKFFKPPLRSTLDDEVESDTEALWFAEGAVTLRWKRGQALLPYLRYVPTCVMALKSLLFKCTTN
jgi:hypothetical protein